MLWRICTNKFYTFLTLFACHDNWFVCKLVMTQSASPRCLDPLHSILSRPKEYLPSKVIGTHIYKKANYFNGRTMGF